MKECIHNSMLWSYNMLTVYSSAIETVYIVTKAHIPQYVQLYTAW